MLLVAAVQDMPAAAPQAEDEITVIARKLDTWRGSINVQNGAPACKTLRSTGDLEIDAIGCLAMTVCFPRYMPRFRAVDADKTLGADARKQANAQINAEVTACFAVEHDAGIKALADKRAAI